MDDIKIRKATRQDLPVLLTFEQGIIQAERPFDSTLKNDPISYYDIEDYIKAADKEVLVAEIANDVVASGFARIEKAESFLKHDQYTYLGFMYVKPEYRGKGINSKILNALIKWSTDQDIQEIRLEVYDGNSPAIRAYEKAGFKKNLIEMRFNLNNN